MKKLLLAFLCISFTICATFNSASAYVLGYGDNTMYFANHEALFRWDSTALNGQGAYVEQDFSDLKDPGIQIGDIFVGIIMLDHVTNQGATIWDFDAGSDEVTGIFAQKVTSFYTPGNDPYSIQNSAHLGLSAVNDATATFLTLNNDVFTTGLSGDEMLALYLDQVATPYEYNGTIVQDISNATDGTKWVSFGYNLGADGLIETADDTGYAYSHTTIGTPLGNFSGENFSGLNVIYDSTSWSWNDVTNPNELESMQWITPYATTDVYFDADLTPNQDYDGYISPVTGNPGPSFSPWAFTSEDPAYVNVVPEPGTFLLFGLGLFGIASIGRKRNN